MSTYQTLFTNAMQLNAIAREMKVEGFPIDPDRRAAHLKRLGEAAAIAAARFREIVAPYANADNLDLDEEDETNLNSSKQIADIFYNKLHMRPRPHYFSKKTGKPGVTKSALRDAIVEGTGDLKLAAEALRDYRENNKYKKDYVGEGYVGEKGHYGLPVFKHDGRVHYNFNAVTAATFRWTSNGQQVPKPVYDKNGKVIREGLRDMYVAPKDWVLVEADYSQMQMRIFGSFANCPALVNELNRPNGDTHALTGSIIAKIPRAEFDKEKHKGFRDFGKTLNFGGVMFGGSDEVLHAQIAPKYPELTVLHIANIKKLIYQQMPEIPRYQKDQVQFANLYGYTPIPNEDFKIYWQYDQLNGTKIGDAKSTNVINERIQLKEALIANRAMVKVYRRFQECWPDAKNRPRHCLQFHDAQFVFCRPDDVERVGAILAKEMYHEEAWLGQVMTYPVDIKCGDRWSDLKEMKI